MDCEKIKDNKNYFTNVEGKYKINNEVFGDYKKLLKFDVDKIKLAAEYFTEKPIAEHCYQFGLEKWHDWFTIPYYYLTNKIESQELKDIYESTWSQGECYDKCDDSKVVAISGDKTKCISINNFKGGKYKDLLPYDPIALISLLASFNEYKKDKNLIKKTTPSDNSYSYTDIIYKYENDTTLYDKNKNDIKKLIIINDIDVSNLNYYKNNILIDDIENAIIIVLKYIQNLIDNSLSTGIIEDSTEQTNIINEIIENDLNKFYYLFDEKDEYYLDYLTKKINHEPTLILGKYCGAQHAYKHAQKNTEIKTVIPDNIIDGDKFKTIVGEKKDIYIKYLRHIFKYSKELCFTNNYLFLNRLKIYGVIIIDNSKVTITIDEKSDKKFNSNNNIKIEKEIHGSFSNYEYVLKYYNSLPTIAYFLVLISAFIIAFYYLLYAWDVLHYAAFAINGAVMLLIYLPTLFLYGVILLILFIANIVVFLPLSIVMKLYGALRPYFTVLLILIIFAMFIMAFTINGRKIILDMIKLAWKLFIGIINLIIDIIIWILKQDIITSLIIIYLLYLTYSIIYNDLEILIERHLDFFIKRNLIELRISQFLVGYIKNGNDSFDNMLFKYNIN